MKASEVYLNAARSLERGEVFNSACWAIVFALEKGNIPMLPLSQQRGTALAMRMKHLFAPFSKKAYWLDPIGRDGRILALCFMAAIAESEGN